MDKAAGLEPMALEDDQDRRISEVVTREQSRLRRFIRRRVPDPRDVEDILQDVFSELVEANRLLMPIEHVTGWLFRVARNRITDLFRDRTLEVLQVEDLLPSPDGGPEAEYARAVLLEALEQAIAELPPEQRDVFIGHEVEGRSFKEMAAATGVNTSSDRLPSSSSAFTCSGASNCIQWRGPARRSYRHGPTTFSAFHVIGALFDTAYADGNPQNVQHGMQTVTIPPGGGYMVELVIPDAGLYPFVTHSFAYTGRGALGLLKIGDGGAASGMDTNTVGMAH